MERLAYLAPEEQDKIDAPDLAFILSPDAAAAGPLSLDLPLADATQQFQTEYIKQHIERARGNMTAAAEQARPAPQQPLSQDAAAGDGDGRRIGGAAMQLRSTTGSPD